MAHAEHSATVDRPIREVFAFLADGLNNPRWRPDVTSIELVSGSRLGARYAQSMKGPGRRTIRGDYTITRYDEPNRLDFDVTAGPARPTGSFRLRELTPTSTEVTFELTLTPTGLMRLAGPMITKQMQTEVARIDGLEPAMDERL
ncbi:MAG: SRPBCC family protein [Actinomycetales bacterium]